MKGFIALIEGNNRPSSEWSETWLLLAAITTVMLVGTIGYMFLEGWGAFDAFYMTVITLSTVGYGEIHPLSDGGRVFTVILIAIGVGAAMLVLTSLSRKILEHQISWVLRRGRMKEQIDKLSGHTIFCGFGRLSQIAVDQLHLKSVPMVIIDVDEQRIDLAQEHGLLGVTGDATTDEVLVAAGVKRASRLVSLLPKDADNLYAILAASELNPEIFLVTRAESGEGEKRLRQAGANRIISPYRVGGLKIADGLLRPHVTDFLDLAVYSKEGDLIIEEFCVPDKSPLAGKTLKSAFLRDKTNMIVAAIISPSGETKFNPSGDSIIEAGSTLIGLGLKTEFENLENMLLGE